MSYGTILQLAGFSLIMAVWYLLLFSERFFMKMWFVWRFLFLVLATLLTASVFAVIFKWFPADSLQSWTSFILSTVICFVISTALTLLKLKIKGKKYNALLANYKARWKEGNQSRQN
jgi:Na+/melibiose symporter-like transporter